MGLIKKVLLNIFLYLVISSAGIFVTLFVMTGGSFSKMKNLFQSFKSVNLSVLKNSIDANRSNDRNSGKVTEDSGLADVNKLQKINKQRFEIGMAVSGEKKEQESDTDSQDLKSLDRQLTELQYQLFRLQQRVSELEDAQLETKRLMQKGLPSQEAIQQIQPQQLSPTPFQPLKPLPKSK